MTPFPLLAVRALRAREGELTDLWSTTSSELSQLDRALRRTKNRLRWRRLWQRRCSTIAAAMKAIEAALDKPVRRKNNGAWLFFSPCATGLLSGPAAVLRAGGIASFSDFRRPVVVEVVSAEHVDTTVLLPRLKRLGVAVR